MTQLLRSETLPLSTRGYERCATALRRLTSLRDTVHLSLWQRRGPDLDLVVRFDVDPAFTVGSSKHGAGNGGHSIRASLKDPEFQLDFACRSHGYGLEFAYAVLRLEQRLRMIFASARSFDGSGAEVLRNDRHQIFVPWSARRKPRL